MSSKIAEPIRMPASAATFRGFRAWTKSPQFPSDGQIFFIDQEIYIDMSPERLDSHNKVKTEVTCVVGGLVRDGDRGNFYSDRTRVVNEEAGLSNEPDATFASWESLESGRVRQVPSESEEGDFIELEGTPDWLMEIVSPGSVDKDTRRLRRVYHRAGVGEYWLIDARGEQVLFQILWYRRGGYVTAPIRNGWQRSRVFGCSFRLERRRDRLGQWQYRLHVKRD